MERLLKFFMSYSPIFNQILTKEVLLNESGSEESQAVWGRQAHEQGFEADCLIAREGPFVA